MNIYVITNEIYYKCYILASDLKKALKIYEDNFCVEITDIEVIKKDDVIIGD